MSLRVTKSNKDRDGDITGLCGYGWSHDKSTVVSAIKRDSWAYYVSVHGRYVYVGVRTRNGRDYLTTAPDSYSRNILDDLPDC